MLHTDRDVTRAAETDEELLTFDISDDTLERAAGVADPRAVTLVYATEIVGSCACPI